MELRNRVREVAEEAKERTDEASRVGRDVGETAARETARVGETAYDELLRTAGSAKETAESVTARANEEIDPELPPDPSTVEATADLTAGSLASEIRRFVDAVNRRYAAESALEGARRGYAAGPYGAVLGAGAGTVYGAYASTRATFDPENPPQPVGDLDIDRYLDRVRHARTGYEVGKRFGTKGKVAGAAIGAGVSALPVLAERATAGATGDGSERGDEQASAVTEWIADRTAALPVDERFAQDARRAGALVARNGKTVLRVGGVIVETDWANARRIATESVAAVRDGTVGDSLLQFADRAVRR